MRARVYSSCDKNSKKVRKAKQRIVGLNTKLAGIGIHLQIATDGSSLGNPGPSGAGFVFKEVGYGVGSFSFYSSLSLGHSTNNHAELVALDRALTKLLACPPPDGVPVVFLVDNENALKVAKGLSVSRAYPRLGAQL